MLSREVHAVHALDVGVTDFWLTCNVFFTGVPVRSTTSQPVQSSVGKWKKSNLWCDLYTEFLNFLAFLLIEKFINEDLDGIFTSRKIIKYYEQFSDLYFFSVKVGIKIWRK